MKSVWYGTYIQLLHNHQQYLLKIQLSYTFKLVLRRIVSGMRPISSSTFTINPCSPISRGRVSGLLWPGFTSINVSSTITRVRVAGQTWSMFTTSMITWGIVDGLKRPMSTTFTTSAINWGRVASIKKTMSMTYLSQRHFNTFFLRTYGVVVTATGGIMDGLTRPIY